MLEADQKNEPEVPRADLSIALVHWPIVDKAGSTVVTNITNLDIHDIARAATTYGIKKYFVVNRIKEQLMFVARVLDHWRTGYGKKFNPMRRTALSPVLPIETVDDAIRELGGNPILVGTSARSDSNRQSFRELREMIWAGTEELQNRPILLLFGTGYGLHEKLMQRCDYILEPIKGMPPEDYRHLSVRSAVSICLDRLLGKW